MINSDFQTAFDANFQERGEVGAAVSIWHGEEEIVSLAGGFRERERTQPWTAETLVPIWSATKGVAAACALTALDEAGHDLREPVSKIWPELAGPSFAQLLSHQAGLAALDNPPAMEDYAAVIRALENAANHPNWPPGSGHGYHPRTFGFLADELVRRASGAESLPRYWRERFAEPLKLDLWLGLPVSEDARVAEIIAARASVNTPQNEFYRAFANPDSLSRRAFASPRGVNAVSDMRRPENWRHGYPSMGGIASARGLAQFYALFANGGMWKGQRVISETVCQWAETLQVSGRDLVLLTETAFSAGFMKDPVDAAGQKLRQIHGPSLSAFGHPGAGGSHAFADPEHGFAFAYVMNQMELGVLPNEKSLSLVRELYRSFPR